MSGGVDSSVSAALLKKAGYDVTGVFIKVWQPDWIDCNWKEERLEAMRAAAHLDIPFITLDLEQEYKRGVIDYMIAEYKVGRTPNPDVMCNREVKFGAFWKWAKENGAGFIATGHYARNIEGQLLIGVDSNKDQSYFLWTLNRDDLAHVMFPVGDIEKPEVRKLAKKFKLPNAEKKDSQGLCFIGKVDVKEFLAHYIKMESGRVLNKSGEVIGGHPGSLLFTIGERHGFKVDAEHKTPEDLPYYVISKDIDKNIIMVSNRDAAHSLPQARNSVCIRNGNWVSAKIPSKTALDVQHFDGFPLQARSRYRQELQRVRIVAATISEAEIEFEKPQDTLTPGQSLVIYDGELCLGGGVIEGR